jgi:hypothetical protein
MAAEKPGPAGNKDRCHASPVRSVGG